MKKIFLNLKTSDKITFLFGFFNFIGLIILLFAINMTYFFIWYSDQEKESLYDMNINYNNYIVQKTDTNIEAFKNYILEKNTLIIPADGGELICSNGVETKIHNDISKIKDKLFYNNGKKTFFIYTKNYPEIGQVKVFFDTTPYVKSQIIIIKISLFIIFASLFIFYFLGKKITNYSFRNLTKLSKQTSELDIEKDFEELKIIGNPNDEINILAQKINCSFFHIKNQTNNLKQFITDVSHEFKTPLMVINSEIDLYNKKIEKNKLEKNDTINLLINIKGNTKELNNLLETFLLFSRIENNIEKLEKKEVDFSKILRNNSQKYIENNKIIKDIGKGNYNIIYKIEENINLKIEENTFDILISNIISNAIKFSKNNISKNKKVELEIGLEKNLFYIKDNGIGIKDDDLENIFNKFFRNDKNIEGFGVGLFLVKRLVQLYNWKISVESKEGKGTKFIINF